ncbi:protein-export chaperone SecB [Flavobacterium sp.]|uniref:protein-export chaperone SecB n=1 Tax=Flavobacterium sp. TaxID=239 RepID=UPI0031E3ACB2
MSTTPAKFQLTNYFFNKFELNFQKDTPKDVNVNFDVRGEYNESQNLFDIHLAFTAFPKTDREDNFIKVNCIGTFQLQDVNSLSEIPPYFYSNAIAILFPYLRSGVSILTVQANITALVLPTFNLVELGEPLRNNTTVV